MFGHGHNHDDIVQFAVTVAADDLTLLTAQQLRMAVGLSADDESKDAVLTPLGLQIASEIAAAAKIAKGGFPITLRAESCRATFYLRRRTDKLILPRRFVSSIASVVECGDTLDPAVDMLLEGEAGLLSRMRNDWPCWWPCGKIVIDFVCGFDEIEDDLRGGAMDLVQIRLSETSRDPLIKSIQTNIPEMEDRRVDYWVGGVPNSAGYGSLPDSVAKKLSRYVGVVLG